MATMHPASLAGYDSVPDSERKVFSALSRLGEGYHVFHSVAWCDGSEGECDFIVFHPGRGFLALEVKGGGIDCRNDVWYSTDRSGVEHQLKNPVHQARNSMNAILDFFKKKYDRFNGTVGWAVAFPDIRWKDDRIVLVPARVLDADSLQNAPAWVDALFHVLGWTPQTRVSSEEEAAHFLRILEKDISVPLSMRHMVEEQERVLRRINFVQDYLVDLFTDKAKIGFQGAAGTGKTWIAIKKAALLAGEGKRVLVLCYNKLVNELIRERLQAYPAVEVATFHSFAKRMLGAGLLHLVEGLPDTDAYGAFIAALCERGYPARGETREPKERKEKDLAERINTHVGMLTMFRNEDVYGPVIETFQDRLPAVLLDTFALLLPGKDVTADFYGERIAFALANLLEHLPAAYADFAYDAILVDEGQDFHRSWCDCLKALFAKYRSRIFWVFYDDNQAIFGRQKDLPVTELLASSGLGNHLFRLRDNLRNTDTIHRYAVEKTGLGATAHPSSIRGVAPEEVTGLDAAAARAQVGSWLARLVGEHGVSERQLLVLSNRSIKHSIFSGSATAGDFKLVAGGEGARPGTVRFRTIAEFKGMEADVVILVIHERPADRTEERYLAPELLYVGYTRAKHLLYVVRVAGE